MSNAASTYDGWIIGQHELPVEVPASVYSLAMERQGDVLVRARRRNGTWHFFAREKFDAQYEWITE